MEKTEIKEKPAEKTTKVVKPVAKANEEKKVSEDSKDKKVEAAEPKKLGSTLTKPAKKETELSQKT